MSGWNRERSNSVESLTLEISVFSKSDMDHGFWNHLHFDSCPLTPFGELEIDRPRLNDTGHGWETGELIGPHTLHLIMEITRRTSNLHGNLELEPVPAVKTFIVRRQTRRQLSATALNAVVKNLPNLTSMVLETWRSKMCSPGTGLYPDDPGKPIQNVLHMVH